MVGNQYNEGNDGGKRWIIARAMALALTMIKNNDEIAQQRCQCDFGNASFSRKKWRAEIWWLEKKSDDSGERGGEKTENNRGKVAVKLRLDYRGEGPACYGAQKKCEDKERKDNIPPLGNWCQQSTESAVISTVLGRHLFVAWLV